MIPAQALELLQAAMRGKRAELAAIQRGGPAGRAALEPPRSIPGAALPRNVGCPGGQGSTAPASWLGPSLQQGQPFVLLPSRGKALRLGGSGEWEKGGSK